MHVGIVYTSTTSSRTQVDVIEIASATDFEFLHEVEKAVEAQGHIVSRIETSELLSSSPKLSEIDLALNLSCGLRGPNSESLVPAILDSLNIPYTGSDTLSTAMCQDKFSCNSALRGLRLPTPVAVYLDSMDAVMAEDGFGYPAIIKPNSRRAAVGITESSFVENKGELIAVAEVLFEKELGPLILEEFVEGRELVVPVLASSIGEEVLDLPIMEVDLEGHLLYGSELRSTSNGPKINKALFNIKALKHNLLHLAHAAFVGLGLRGWGKVDLKLKTDNTPEIIEVESIPDIASVIPWTTLSAKIAGVDLRDIVRLLIEGAQVKARDKITDKED